MCDVSNAASVDALLGQALEQLGGLPDVILNNAGYSGSYKVGAVLWGLQGGHCKVCKEETLWRRACGGAPGVTLVRPSNPIGSSRGCWSASPPFPAGLSAEPELSRPTPSPLSTPVPHPAPASRLWPFLFSLQSLSEMSAEQVEQVVRTNLLGSLLITRASMRAAAAAADDAAAAAGGSPAQQRGGRAGDEHGSSPVPHVHVFNMEGAGSDGSATPQVGGVVLRHTRLCCCRAAM